MDIDRSDPAVPLAAVPGGVSAGFVSELDLLGDWGVLATDRNLRITRLNGWLERHLGRPAEALLGLPLLEVFPSLVARKLDRYYGEVLLGRVALLSQRLHRYLLPLPTTSHETRFDFMQQTARILPLHDECKVLGTVTLIEDVTERVAYESELRERVEALRDADRRKDEFLAMLAHELRNPLAPIRNAVDLIRLTGNSDRTVETARMMIERQVDHLVRLVDDLLDVSRVSRGKIALQKAPIDLAAATLHAIETSRPLIDARGHRFTVSLPHRPIRVEGDFTRLGQVVSNLLNNSAKYTDERGEITLTLDRVGNDAILRVSDTGRGIDTAHLSSLFDLFYQADRNLDRSDGGLGIGLSLVKSLVEMHGGSVTAKSAGRGKGSQFTVRLPCLPETSVEAPANVGEGSSFNATPSRILVVDDNEDSANSMAMLLRLEGHEVFTANDGRKAVEIALRERPAAVLLDIGLPVIDGYQACREIREGGLTDALIVAMTGYGQDEDRRLALSSGFDAHEVKPLNLTSIRKLFARE